jgi:hypothetical protein
MIQAGKTHEILWGEGNWVFLDIGFAKDAKSCGLLVGDDEPVCVQFGAAKRQIVRLAEQAGSPLNLVIEAPLSVCFTAAGNPTGRSVEKNGSKTRYWYNGLGCAVMVAAMYLVRELHSAQSKHAIHLFEGFVSYKDRTVPTDHRRDVLFLRDVVRNPERFAKSIVAAEELRVNPTDKISSAFCVADIDCGVPALIRQSA